MAVTVRRSRRVWIVVVAVVVLTISATAFAAARSSAAPEYRTAKAATGDVKATLDVTGTIQPVDRADLTFPVAGVVAAVPVALGQHVAAGTVLAQLDTTALDAQVASAKSQLAAAKAKLAADRSGKGSGAAQTAAGNAAAAAAAGAWPGAGRGGAAAAPGEAGTPSAGQANAAAAGLAPGGTAAVGGRATEAQAGDAPGTVPRNAGGADTAPGGAAPTVAGQASAAAAAGGAPAVAGQSNGPQTGAPPAAAEARPAGAGPAAAGAAGGGSDEPAPRGATPPATGAAQQALQQATDALAKARDARESHQQAAEAALATVQQDLDAAGSACEPDGDGAACRVALKKVLDGETAVATLQKQVAADNKALDAGIAVLLQAAAKLASAASAIPMVPPTAVPPAGAVPPGAVPPAAATPRAPAAPTGGTARAATAVSAEQLAADQAAVDAAAAQLATAQQNRDQSTITSPFDGTVGALTLQPGQRVSGAGATPVVVVGAARGYQVQATVGEADVARLAVGNTVVVTPDGAAAPLAGTVSSIGILPTTATAGSVSYPVTIALPAGSGPFPAGQGASVAIQVADVAGVLTVPTSAVHTTGAIRTVDVVRGGRSVPVQVQVGAVGATRTEITSGLAAGDEVVLADPSRPLPTTGFSGLSRIGGR